MPKDNNNDRISVIIPVHNNEDTVAACLDAVLGQSHAALQVICVDDGSVDGTARILDGYAAKDARVKVLHTENRGAGAARNEGLLHAAGGWLSFLDADDVFEPAMYERMLARALDTGAEVCVCASDARSAADGGVSYNFSALREEFLPRTPVFSHRDAPTRFFGIFRGWPWDKLFRADLIRDNALRFQEIENANDFCFVYTALALADRITCLPEVLVHKLTHRTGSLSTTADKRWDCAFAALTNLRGELEGRGLYDALAQSFHNRALDNLVWHYAVLTEEGREAFGDLLRTGGADQLGLLGKTDDYFYDKKSLRAFMRILEGLPPEGQASAGRQALAHRLRLTLPGIYRLYRRLKYRG
ncbi:MAG: glycosyltransferase [Clostridiales Family XIII bacterium]|jgi:glycosyltransferase involved in cell wall biosynthesis|nr:glycosyltransferase [Clostridiales Family XIII bacterium]